MLFDWLVTARWVSLNPAHAVRGPRYLVSKGSTPVTVLEEARALLAGIEWADRRWPADSAIAP